MTSKSKILEIYRAQILKACEHLHYSYQKVQKLSAHLETLTTEQLENWEAFVSRFGRVGDLFLAKCLRVSVLIGDSAFRGSLRDLVDQGEKLNLLENADTWMEIRELRNVIVHEYADANLKKQLERMRQLTPLLLSLRSKG